MDLITIWNQFLAEWGPYILGLLGLIVVDLLMGIASALKRKVFKWEVIAEFYRSTIAPRFLVWIALSVLFKSATNSVLGPALAVYFDQAVIGGSYLVIVSSLLASIYANYQEVTGQARPTETIPPPRI